MILVIPIGMYVSTSPVQYRIGCHADEALVRRIFRILCALRFPAPVFFVLQLRDPERLLKRVDHGLHILLFQFSAGGEHLRQFIRERLRLLFSTRAIAHICFSFKLFVRCDQVILGRFQNFGEFLEQRSVLGIGSRFIIDDCSPRNTNGIRQLLLAESLPDSQLLDFLGELHVDSSSFSCDRGFTSSIVAPSPSLEIREHFVIKSEHDFHESLNFPLTSVIQMRYNLGVKLTFTRIIAYVKLDVNTFEVQKVKFIFTIQDMLFVVVSPVDDFKWRANAAEPSQCRA